MGENEFQILLKRLDEHDRRSEKSLSESFGLLEQRVGTLIEEGRERKGQLKELYDVLFGTDGSGANPGILGRLKSVEEWREGQIWFQRLLVGAIVAEILLMIFK